MKNNLKYQQIWDKVLSTGENLKYEFSVSDSFLKFALIANILFSIPFMFLGGIGFIWLGISLFVCLYYMKVANAYAFTDKRVLIHTGWLNTNLTSVDFNKITDVYVRQRFLDKLIIKSGDLAINTAGTNHKEIILKNIANPYEVKKILDSLKG